jgi:O-antigen ligase
MANMRAAPSLDRAIFILLVIGLALAPAWFGSNFLGAWGFNALYFGLLLAAYELGLVIRGRPHPVSAARIRFLVLAFALTLVWAILQTVSFVPPSWQHPLWELARQAAGLGVDGRISVAPDETLLAALRLVTAGAVFWLALQLCRTAALARWFLLGLACIGLFYAAYGILSFLLFPDRLLYIEKTVYTDAVTSTFVNRNSYATFAGISLISALAALVDRYDRAAHGAPGLIRFRIAGMLSAASGRGGLLLVCMLVIAASLMMTASRGGIAAMTFGVLVFAALLSLRGRRRAGGTALAAVSCAGLIVVAFLLYGDAFVGRLEHVEGSAAGRFAVYRVTLQSIRDGGALGFGYGTFADVFPLYRDATIGIWGIWDKAHNSYLELYQGLGIPVATLFLAGIAHTAWRCAAAALRRRREFALPLAAISTTGLVGVHAFVDFSLQIQAVALAWTALLAAGLAQSWSSRIATADR